MITKGLVDGLNTDSGLKMREGVRIVYLESIVFTHSTKLEQEKRKCLKESI